MTLAYLPIRRRIKLVNLANRYYEEKSKELAKLRVHK